ncbi:MAG: bifunctional diguanylate cyclase/phosphodiesterase [Deltaproteobacteria bacterium]|nr:bifunctional diguanylate cyclase/phosphodiesterase [Deltaproteobacteria bacterium]
MPQIGQQKPKSAVNLDFFQSAPLTPAPLSDAAQRRGLLDRQSFNQELEHAIQTPDCAPFALIILGLDRFRDINHILGPNKGDALLKQLAKRFHKAIGASSIKAHLGGDEFAALLPALGKPQLDDICRRILRTVDSPFVIDGVPIDLAASIGVALYPAHSDNANLLFQRATIALENTKQHSRGFSIYDSSSDPYTELKQAYVSGLRSAIEQNQLALFYQPKVDLRTGKMLGVEALAQWHHPQHGLLPAYQFVPVAERTGLIHALSRWVLREAIAQCRLWHRVGFHIPVAVNLSPRNFNDDSLPDYIDGLLKEYDLPADLLEIEITENVILNEDLNVSKALEHLSSRGMRIYIDDFGTGYSSFGNLKKLPITGIKIDRTFISQMTTNDHDQAIVRSIIDLGQRLALQVIAEGVETQEMWDRLASLGCDVAQGFHMARPMAATDIGGWYLHSPWGAGKASVKQIPRRMARAIKPRAS